ncbi:MAG: 3-hydroxyacyl-ACP dehydratase FabZ [Planctomycetes bacterium]|nr:3-hydroxyacyl-ACP dehydratase FabZ [Planctomycetota bacterium]
MSLEDVKAAIPHRDPFLWVDEIVEQSEDRIRTRKVIAEDLDVFRGHYPGQPILPGVLICEAIFQTGAILLSARAREAVESEGLVPVMTRIKDTRFKRMVRPGDTLEIEVEIEDSLPKLFHLKGKAKVSGKLAVSCSFACALSQG